MLCSTSTAALHANWRTSRRDGLQESPHRFGSGTKTSAPQGIGSALEADRDIGIVFGGHLRGGQQRDGRPVGPQVIDNAGDCVIERPGSWEERIETPARERNPSSSTDTTRAPARRASVTTAVARGSPNGAHECVSRPSGTVDGPQRVPTGSQIARGERGPRGLPGPGSVRAGHPRTLLTINSSA